MSGQDNKAGDEVFEAFTTKAQAYDAGFATGVKWGQERPRGPLKKGPLPCPGGHEWYSTDLLMTGDRWFNCRKCKARCGPIPPQFDLVQAQEKKHPDCVYCGSQAGCGEHECGRGPCITEARPE